MAKNKKILVMGLPGSGKSYLSDKLATLLGAEWLNADRVRTEANDWDFSPEGRTRQAERMKHLAQEGLDRGKHVIADFVCPTEKTRQDFAADYIVWVDTIKEGRFEDTNKMFVPPEEYDFRVPTQNAELWSLRIADEIQEHVWDNRKPTAQMLGRWQPWHEGHQALFEEIVKKTGQVNIQVRDVQGVGDNPFNFETVKKNIEQALQPYKNRIQVTLVPNITNICYGRGVGYKIEEIVLSENIQKISATDIRKKMRAEGKL
jgi:adenylate kinase family enzyme/phosphopantetheine adenylyltransferase